MEGTNFDMWRFIARATYLGAANIGVYFLLAQGQRLGVFLVTPRRDTRAPLAPRPIVRAIKYGRLLQRGIRRNLRANGRYIVLQVLRIIVNLYVCVTYVFGTYRQDVSGWLRLSNIIVAAILAVDLFFHITMSEYWQRTMLEFSALANAFSIPSLIIASGPNEYTTYGFLRAYVAYAVYERLDHKVAVWSRHQLFLRFFLRIVMLVFVLAGGIMLFEIPGDLISAEFEARWSGLGDWHFFTALYYTVVTLSTVGYGDFSPVTVLGRLYVIFTIALFVLVFINTSNQVIDEVKSLDLAGSFRRGRHERHVIILGTPRLSDLKRFMAELGARCNRFHSEVRVVVLMEKKPWTTGEWTAEFGKSDALHRHISALTGSIETVRDQRRVRLDTAEAVFIIMSSPGSMFAESDDGSEQGGTKADAIATDGSVLRIAHHVRNCRTNIPIYATVMRKRSVPDIHNAVLTEIGAAAFQSTSNDSPHQTKLLYDDLFAYEMENAPRYVDRAISDSFTWNDATCDASTNTSRSNGTERQYQAAQSEGFNYELERSKAICPQEINLNLISAHVRANGVGTLLTNLVLDVAFEDKKASGESVPAWLSEFQTGAVCQILHLPIPDRLEGQPFSRLVRPLYNNGLLLLATQGITKGSQPSLVLDLNAKFRTRTLGLFVTFLEPSHAMAGLLQTANMFESEPIADGIGVGNGGVHDNTRADGNDPEPLSLPKPSHNAPDTTTSDVISKPEKENPEDDQIWNRDFARRTALVVGREKIPWDLRGHLIVCADGKEPLDTIPWLLEKLWGTDGNQKSKPFRDIVIIHPEQPQEFQDTIACRRLHLVRGPTNDIHTWTLARVDQAMGIVLLADHSASPQAADERVILTSMAVDRFTEGHSSVFVVTELIDESSLTGLGGPLSNRRIAKCSVPRVESSIQSVQRNSNAGDGSNSGGHGVFGLGGLNLTPASAPEDDAGNVVNEILNNIEETPRQNLTKEERGKLFSRSRYASGDLLLSAMPLSLLVREFFEPGFMSFFHDIIGTEFGDKGGLKIRVVRPPRSLFDSGSDSDSSSGSGSGPGCIKYKVIFDKLVGLGVLPLGLYRSGAAPVELPQDKRSVLGKVLIEECEDMGRSSAGSTASSCTPGIRSMKRGIRDWANGQSVSTPVPQSCTRENSSASGYSQQNRGAGCFSSKSEGPANRPSPGSREEWLGRFAGKNITGINFETDHKRASNRLPYVLTMPPLWTEVSMYDGVYILCDPKRTLADWKEGYGQGQHEDQLRDDSACW